MTKKGNVHKSWQVEKIAATTRYIPGKIERTPRKEQCRKKSLNFGGGVGVVKGTTRAYQGEVEAAEEEPSWEEEQGGMKRESEKMNRMEGDEKQKEKLENNINRKAIVK